MITMMIVMVIVMMLSLVKQKVEMFTLKCFPSILVPWFDLFDVNFIELSNCFWFLLVDLFFITFLN